MLWVSFMPDTHNASPADQNNPDEREPHARQGAFDPDDRKGVGPRTEDTKDADVADEEIEEIDLDQLEESDGPDA
ncbi:MAG: hypothetical protein M3680_06720 [Myxococcota bacterium]|nr:hypothetical protein [Myxococcota bacterium]